MTTKPRRLASLLLSVGIVAAMLLLVGFSLPLYRAFCEATGFAGTPRRSLAAHETSTRTILVRFNADVAADLPWRFEPEQRSVTVRLGTPERVTFLAENEASEAIVGHASFNVTPELAGRYFNKIQCFCFDEERVDGHQRVEMPVIFFVDPAILDDPDLKTLPDLTLSYTFFRSRAPGTAKPLDRLGPSGVAQAAVTIGDAGHGQVLFEARCTACHALDRDKVGPALAALAGRRIGSEPGFAYSGGLKNSDVVWSPSTLDRWLAGPAQMIPGARMPMSIPDPRDRADLEAYLMPDAMPQAGQVGSGATVRR